MVIDDKCVNASDVPETHEKIEYETVEVSIMGHMHKILTPYPVSKPNNAPASGVNSQDGLKTKKP
jgi:hypothetical protein